MNFIDNIVAPIVFFTMCCMGMFAAVGIAGAILWTVQTMAKLFG